ncbi:helix-turn-helix transcriptional regulator [bacterium]|nr:helix-turn-helix transcriptional regulator [bacterium]
MQMTQEKLAELVDISPRNLSGIEKGTYFVKAETLEKIIKALNTSAEELFATEHIKTSDELISEIIEYVQSYKEEKSKLEYIYRMVKFLKDT